jgi:hypothetical protein
MGGFSAQVQPNQVSGPASKGAGMSANQMGMNPIDPSLTQKMEDSMMQPQASNQAIDPTTGMMGGQMTMPGQGGQPKFGMPNAYSNTVQPWDNQAQQPQGGMGKGLGGLTNQIAKQTGKGV